MASLAVVGRDEELVAIEEFLAAVRRELPRRLLAGSLNHPTAPVWTDAIETLIRLGEHELATSYFERYEDSAERLASSPAIAGAARCRGLLEAGAELRRISGRRGLPAELTETERCVAELAAQGRSNKEIAAELFTGVSTVEAHLSHVYRKLDVKRAGLTTRLAMIVDEAVKATDEAAQL